MHDLDLRDLIRISRTDEAIPFDSHIWLYKQLYIYIIMYTYNHFLGRHFCLLWVKAGLPVLRRSCPL